MIPNTKYEEKVANLIKEILMIKEKINNLANKLKEREKRESKKEWWS